MSDMWGHLQQKIQSWSSRTFGDRGITGPEVALTHLKKEADEALANVNDLVELADIQILLWDAMWRAGFNMNDLFYGIIYKHNINLARDWSRQPDGTFRHVEKEPV